jgi:hypothetical protein
MAKYKKASEYEVSKKGLTPQNVKSQLFSLGEIFHLFFLTLQILKSDDLNFIVEPKIMKGVTK